ncbi:MAG TPA: helicase HerA-like domain-containing protein, partial [Pedobacter sp.]|nr:helicase HerA-like domain-containing protein [Pedobacter sp.]
EIDKVLTSLGTGQALVTVLNEKGIPTEVAATMLTPPKAIMGPMAAIDCEKLMQASNIFIKYQKAIDPVSAFEMLTDRINQKMAEDSEIKATQEEQKNAEQEHKSRAGEKTIVEQVMGATITRQIGKEIVRGLFGMLTGKKPRSRSGGIFGF